MVQYFDVRLKSALGPQATADTGRLEGDDIGIGFTAGVMITPWAGTQLRPRLPLLDPPPARWLAVASRA